jgi:hypothetical protein
MTRTRERKGWKCPALDLTTLDVLVRDNWSNEIPLNELSNELLSIFWGYERGEHGLSPTALDLYHRIKRRNGGTLLKPKLARGRPREKWGGLSIAVAVAKAVAEQTGKKNRAKAIRGVSDKPPREFTKDSDGRDLPNRTIVPATVRDIYYRHLANPELRRELERALMERALPVAEHEPEPEAEPPVMMRTIPSEFYEAGLPPWRTELTEEDYQWWAHAARNWRESRDRRERALRMVSRPRRLRLRRAPKKD